MIYYLSQTTFFQPEQITSFPLFLCTSDDDDDEVLLAHNHMDCVLCGAGTNKRCHSCLNIITIIISSSIVFIQLQHFHFTVLLFFMLYEILSIFSPFYIWKLIYPLNYFQGTFVKSAPFWFWQFQIFVIPIMWSGYNHFSQFSIWIWPTKNKKNSLPNTDIDIIIRAGDGIIACMKNQSNATDFNRVGNVR